jgi:hypothetical protein
MDKYMVLKIRFAPFRMSALIRKEKYQDRWKHRIAFVGYTCTGRQAEGCPGERFGPIKKPVPGRTGF